MADGPRFFESVRHIRANGVGFQEANWNDHPIMKYVRNLPGETAIYSDNPNLIYYATGRATYELPLKIECCHLSHQQGL